MVDGGRFINTLDFPKLGYIHVKPDLVITRLVAVSDSEPEKGAILTVGKDAEQVVTPLPSCTTLDIQMFPVDSQKFEALTSRTLGTRY